MSARGPYEHKGVYTPANLAVLAHERRARGDRCPVHPICRLGHDEADCGWCPECHPEVPEW